MNDYENIAIGFYGFINDINKNISKMYKIIILLICFLFICVVIIILLLLKNKMPKLKKIIKMNLE